MKVDGAVLNTESDAPWNCSFDSTKVADGTHTLSATAYDTAGNTRTASISVNVANLVDPAPAPTPVPTPEPEPAPSPTPGTFPGGGLTSPSTAATATGRTSKSAPHPARRRGHPPRVGPDRAGRPTRTNIVYAAAAKIHTRIHAQLGGNELGTASQLPRIRHRLHQAATASAALSGNCTRSSNEAAYAITTVELGNEPYFGEMSASLYADTVRPTLEAIKPRTCRSR